MDRKRRKVVCHQNTGDGSRKEMKLESVAIAKALQLEGRPTSRQSFWTIFSQLCAARAYKLLFSRVRSQF